MRFCGDRFYEDAEMRNLSLEAQALLLRALWSQWRDGKLPTQLDELRDKLDPRHETGERFEKTWPMLAEVLEANNERWIESPSAHQPTAAKQGRAVRTSELLGKITLLATRIRWEKAPARVNATLTRELRDVPDRVEAGYYMKIVQRVLASGNAVSADVLAKSQLNEGASAACEGTLQLVEAYAAGWSEYVREFGERAIHSNGVVTVERARLQGGLGNSELSRRYSGPFNYEMSNVQTFLAAAVLKRPFQEWLDTLNYSARIGNFAYSASSDDIAKVLEINIRSGSLLEATLHALKVTSDALESD